MQPPFPSHRLRLEIVLESGTLSCRAILDGNTVGTRAVPEPYGMAAVWDSVGRGGDVEGALIAAGRRLGRALLDEQTLVRVAAIVDGLPPDSVLEVVIEANPAALGLPFELIRLPAARVLARLPEVTRVRRRSGPSRGTAAPGAPGPLKVLVALTTTD